MISRQADDLLAAMDTSPDEVDNDHMEGLEAEIESTTRAFTRASIRASSRTMSPASFLHAANRHVIKRKGAKITLEPRVTVELKDHDFIRITEVFKNPATGKAKIRGQRFTRRTEFFQGNTNEVCKIIHAYLNDARKPDDQGIEEVDVADVVDVRVLKLTNTLFPHCSYREDPQMNGQSKGVIKAKGALTCRQKYIIYYPDANPYWKDKIHWLEHELANLRFEEADPGCQVNDEELRRDFRGETQDGGMHSGPVLQWKGRSGRQSQYTLVDGFCGAGGATCGATQAGIRPVFAFDMDEHACETFDLNHGDLVTVSQVPADVFLSGESGEDHKADILHISPPCQPYSSAHTKTGYQDDDNIAALYTCAQGLDDVRPRVGMLEQTVGLTHRGHRENQIELVRQFTNEKRPFSIRWKVAIFSDYGLAQLRQRLMVFFSWYVCCSFRISSLLTFLS